MSTVKESKQPKDAFSDRLLFVATDFAGHDYDFDTSEDIFYDSKFIAPKPILLRMRIRIYSTESRPQETETSWKL